MVPGVKYWKRMSLVRGTLEGALRVGRLEVGGRRGWVDLEVLVTLLEGCKEGGKAVANREVAVVVSKLNF